MSRGFIPRALRARIAAQAGHRCGYCLLSERFLGFDLEIDHIVPEALNGPTVEENLWLACSECNARKGTRISARDPLTGERVALFNPRTQAWRDHFAWTAAGDVVIGQTATGRATLHALHLNSPKRVAARRFWVAAGWHPPRD